MHRILRGVIRLVLVHGLVVTCAKPTEPAGNEGNQYNVTNTDPEKGLPVDLLEDEVQFGFPVVDFSVTVDQGTLRGVRMMSVKDNSSFVGFLGVPYAKPPTEELRFKAPLPADPWGGEFIANRSGVVCVQANPVTMEIEGTEDCLVLNIYTAKMDNSSSPLLPVMVWIHGGGFEMGSGNIDIYGPDYFVVQNVVLVTINYRLGALGFLNLQHESVSANAGLKDQVAALRWIKRNIGSFGGDANQVTLFGESAGAACVHYHMLSPMSTGLFHRAISQSGSALNPWAYTMASQSRALLLGGTLGCDVTDVTRTVACLMSLPSYNIIANAHNHTLTKEDERHYIKLPFVPTSEQGRAGFDEVFLPGDPMELMTSGRFNRDVAYITGVNSIEAALFLPQLSSTPKLREIDAELDRLIPGDMRVDNASQCKFLAKRIKTFYFGKEAISHNTLSCFVNMLTDLLFNIGTTKTVHIQSKYTTQPIFMYLFSFDGSLGFAKRLISQTKIPGAVHSDDLGYMFKVSFWDLNLHSETPEMKTLSRMVKMWTNFAKTGNPSSTLDSDVDVTWSPVSKTQQSYLSIDRDLRMRVGLVKERMGFWEQIYQDAAQGINEVDSDWPREEAASSGASPCTWHLLPVAAIFCFRFLYSLWSCP